MRQIVFIDNRVSNGISDEIKRHCTELIRLPSFWGLSTPISAHADVLSHRLPDGRILMSREYFDENIDLLSCYSDYIVLTDEKLRGKYPSDVLFDAFGCDGLLFGHKSGTSEILKSFYKTFISVKQGYTKCSVAYLGGKNAITSDATLHQALCEYGFNVLKISESGIALDGYGNGFIGGAGGLLPDGMYMFFGDYDLHPDGDRISAFLFQNEIKNVTVKGMPLYDHGGLTYITI